MRLIAVLLARKKYRENFMIGFIQEVASFSARFGQQLSESAFILNLAVTLKTPLKWLIL